MTRSRRQAGFSLALTMAVISVLILLAGAIFADVLNNQRGSVLTREQSSLENDATVGLQMAEAELYKNADVLLYSAWSAQVNAMGDLSTTATASPQATASSAISPFPVRPLEVLGNARDWPAFCDWSYYIDSYKTLQPGVNVFAPGAPPWCCGGFGFYATVSYSPPAATPDIEQDGTPSQTVGGASAPIFNEDDPCLTNGWYFVPRDDMADDDYFPGGSCANPTLKTYTLPSYVFPTSIPGATYSAAPPPLITSITYEGTTYGNQSIQPVPHDFWYEDFPICGAISATTSIPEHASWPNAAEGEYGDGNCAASGSTGLSYTGTDAVLPAKTPQMFDTPVYKKVYTLESGRQVAVYCRLDLRDYFAPSCPSCPSYTWPYGGSETMGYRDSGNTLRFYLVAVPEGRVDLVSGGAIYRPATVVNKFVYFNIGGAEDAELATGDVSLTQDGLWDLHDMAPTLESDEEMLPSGASNSIEGYKFRGDGNMGFNWSTYASASSFPISSQRMAYVWEDQPVPNVAGSYSIFFLGVGGTWIGEYNEGAGTAPASDTGWVIERYPYSTESAAAGGEDFGLPAYLAGSPTAPEYQFDTAGSFSAIVDPTGHFVIPWRGNTTEPIIFPSGPFKGEYDQWTGPASGSTYSTGIDGLQDRPGLPFAASFSVLDATR